VIDWFSCRRRARTDEIKLRPAHKLLLLHRRRLPATTAALEIINGAAVAKWKIGGGVTSEIRSRTRITLIFLREKNPGNKLDFVWI
jgi:hypothetical protein